MVRAALYLRVSTDEQTTGNQSLALREIAVRRGWDVVGVYEDAGISGSKGRSGRPGLDRMLTDAVAGSFDVVMAWAVDRLGRSLSDLLDTLKELDRAKVDLFLHQQPVDTTTPAGRAFFQILGVFGEFERAMIQSRVKAGMARVRAEGVVLGRPCVGPEVEEKIRAGLAARVGKTRLARELGVGVSTVMRVSREQ